MCDENIAVSIRSLNQMSSILPNRMEKLKLASLSAGIVAGFTTDCNYGLDLSIMKGYDTTVAGRVNDLEQVLRNFIVLNKSWYHTGARTVSDVRNVFITGRKHPMNTLENIFSVITSIESKQANIEASVEINAALTILRQYSLNLDIPFHRLIEQAKEDGLWATISNFRDSIIKSAKRMTSTGERLDILDDHKLSVIISVVTGLIIGYCEPIPTTAVDFNNYYATTAYPFAMGLVNELVERTLINTDAVFLTYRATLETRYELALEPVATVRGLISVIINKDILSEDMSKAIQDSNKAELLDYIVGMVKGVYDVRKEQAERSVLHELAYLPINPISDMVNRPETSQEVEERMVEMVASSESAIVDIANLLNSRELNRYRVISQEAMTGKQKLGIVFMIIGGALMAYAIYATFFKNAASHTKNIQDFHNQMDKDLHDINHNLATLGLQRITFTRTDEAELKDAYNKLGCGANVKDVVKDVQGAKDVTEVSSTSLLYTHSGKTLSSFYDFSSFKVASAFNNYSKFMEAINNNVFNKILDSDNFKNCRNMSDFIKKVDEGKQQLNNVKRQYSIQFPKEIKNDTVSAKQLADYVKHNVYLPDMIKSMQEAEKHCTNMYHAIDNMDNEAFLAQLDKNLVNAGMPENESKEICKLLKALYSEVNLTLKELAKQYLLLIGNVRVWDKAVVSHLRVVRLTMKTLELSDQIDNPVQKQIEF